MNTLLSITVLIIASTCAGVKTGKLLGFDIGLYNELFEIDIDTGNAVTVHSYDDTTETGAYALAVAPDGTLYSSFQYGIGGVFYLVIIDVESGALDEIGLISPNAVQGIAFGPDGTLYGIDCTANQFITIDSLTGAMTVVGPTGVLNNAGLTFAPDGTLYMVGTPALDAILYTIDPATGLATEVGPFGSNLRFAGAVESIGEALYASASDPFEKPYKVLVSVDPETGAAVKIGSFCPFEKECPNMSGMAFYPGAGDADRDGDVDEDDYLFFVKCFGSLDDPDTSPYCAFLDADDDNDIDCDDWEAFIPNWTEDTDPPTLPKCDCEDPPCVCEGDANGDGTVDPLDSGYVLSRFGCPVGTGDPSCDAADVNGDGAVDPLDSGYVLARLGTCE